MGQLKNATGLVRAFRRALGIVDPGGVERLGETLNPTIDLWSRPEWAALQDMLYGMGYRGLAAGGAAFRSICQLWLPATAVDRIVVVTHVMANVASAICGVYNVALTSTAIAQFGLCDLRLKRQWLAGADFNFQAQLRYHNGAANPADNYPRQLLYTAGLRYEVNMVVAPGTGVTITAPTDNSAMNGCFWFYERPALPGERVAELT